MHDLDDIFASVSGAKRRSSSVYLACHHRIVNATFSPDTDTWSGAPFYGIPSSVRRRRFTAIENNGETAFVNHGRASSSGRLFWQAVTLQPRNDEKFQKLGNVKHDDSFRLTNKKKKKKTEYTIRKCLLLPNAYLSCKSLRSRCMLRKNGHEYDINYVIRL